MIPVFQILHPPRKIVLAERYRKAASVVAQDPLLVKVEVETVELKADLVERVRFRKWRVRQFHHFEVPLDLDCWRVPAQDI